MGPILSILTPCRNLYYSLPINILLASKKHGLSLFSCYVFMLCFLGCANEEDRHIYYMGQQSQSGFPELSRISCMVYFCRLVPCITTVSSNSRKVHSTIANIVGLFYMMLLVYCIIITNSLFTQ